MLLGYQQSDALGDRFFSFQWWGIGEIQDQGILRIRRGRGIAPEQCRSHIQSHGYKIIGGCWDWREPFMRRRQNVVQP